MKAKRKTKRLSNSDCPLDLQQYARKFLERLDSGRYDITAIDLSHLSDRNLEKLLGFVPANPTAVDISEHMNLAEIERTATAIIVDNSGLSTVDNENAVSSLYESGNSNIFGVGRQDNGVSQRNSSTARMYREKQAKPSGFPKSVPGFKCTVSPAGTVRSTVSGRTLKQSQENGHAYVRVKNDNGAEVRLRVARLVVLAAGLDCYCKTVVHIDEDFTNYSLENLKVVTIRHSKR